MLVRICSLLLLAFVMGCQSAAPAAPKPQATVAPASNALKARIVAVGIPGASAVSPVGTFHSGGPIHDKPDFAAFTQAGRVRPMRVEPNQDATATQSARYVR